MSLDPPTWIDREYIRDCIQDGGKNRQILVKSFDISPAVPPGNNYGSNIWRVKVKYQEKPAEDIQDLSLIVKTPIEYEEGLQETMDKILQIEPTFYYSLLPQLIDKSFAPKSFFSAVARTVVMEDLSTQGYLMADRIKGLDFDQYRLYVRASATFHAATVAAYKNNSELVESLGREKIFTNENIISNGMKRLTSIVVCCIADKMETMDEFKSNACLVRGCAESLWDELAKVYRRSKTLNALGQGDPWTTNMMFKYNSSGKVDGIKLLDFQVLRYSSPVADLVFFIWTSASHEVREHHLEDLYRLYCGTLNEKLEGFNCPERLSYDYILATIKHFYPLILYIVVFNYPVLKYKGPFDFSLVIKSVMDDTLTNESLSDLFCKYLTKGFFEEELPKCLKELESIGMFEYLQSKRYK